MEKLYYLSWVWNFCLIWGYFAMSDRITTCAATTCPAGSECRIVVENSYQIGPKCLKPSLIPGQGSPKRCGTSGHPVLLVKQVGKKIKYVVFIVNIICPTVDLVFVKGICCAETEKVGSCPPVPLSPAESSGRAVGCAFRCRGDNDCKGSYKCCSNSCGGTSCVKPVSGFTCETVDCLPDFTCIETPNGPTCVLISSTCAVLLCPVGTFCVNTPEGAFCQSGQCPTPDPDDDGLCAFSCHGDSGCHPGTTCCRNACGGTDCFPLLTCATVLCIEGTVCVDTPRGPFCQSRKCPNPGPGDVSVCIVQCDVDEDCKKGQRCCRTACGGSTCVNTLPRLTCANVLCMIGTRCIETADGPRCILQKPGSCPLFKCPSEPPLLVSEPGSCPLFKCPSEPPLLVSEPGSCPLFKCPSEPPLLQPCVSDCKEDGDCKCNQKCCFSCPNCTSCIDSDVSHLCDSVVCGPGEECILQPVVCFKEPCPPIPTCVPKGTRFGQCPATVPESLSTCGLFKCTKDGDCGAGQKCCSTSCGGKTCAYAVEYRTCDLEKCGPRQICREVYDQEVGGKVYPQCIEDPPETPPGAACDVGLPLLLYQNQTITVAACGRVLNRVECPAGYICKVAPDDRWSICCRIFPKPGVCPQPACIDRPCENNSHQCQDDNECEGNRKCCKGCSGCKECLPPSSRPPSCDSVVCRANEVCRLQDVQCPRTPCLPVPVCIPEKPGTCPMFRCADRPCKDKNHECQHDIDCKDNLKCCKSCSGCRTCLSPLMPPSVCDSVVCEPGYVCILQNVQCVAPPCLPIPVCVPPGTNPGQCPTPRADSVSLCSFLCDNDTQCTVREKCCPTSCGGTICTPSLPYISNCDNVICPIGQTCREVIHKKGDISPQCLENPPKTPQDDQCEIGLPLLQTYIKDITVVRCYKGRNRTSCPFGYNCKVDPNNTWSLCCRNREGSCIPPCGPRERCQTQVIFCFVPPCPPAPRCETKDICHLPKVVGPCKALIPSYYYNSKSNRCEFFNYGGCRGNENRFPTQDACKNACPKDICHLPKVVGPCDALIPSYYYNTKSNRCEFFNYGGCGGNENRFPTQDACKNACPKDICHLPKVVGPCEALIPSYYYNTKSNRCEFFNYGGCHGNENRFPSKDACYQACRPK